MEKGGEGKRKCKAHTHTLDSQSAEFWHLPSPLSLVMCVAPRKSFCLPNLLCVAAGVVSSRGVEAFLSRTLRSLPISNPPRFRHVAMPSLLVNLLCTYACVPVGVGYAKAAAVHTLYYTHMREKETAAAAASGEQPASQHRHTAAASLD